MPGLHVLAVPTGDEGNSGTDIVNDSAAGEAEFDDSSPELSASFYIAMIYSTALL